MPTNLKLETLKLGRFKSMQQAVNAALAEFITRRNRLKLLELAGKIEFDPAWDYKELRKARS